MSEEFVNGMPRAPYFQHSIPEESPETYFAEKSSVTFMYLNGCPVPLTGVRVPALLKSGIYNLGKN